jgi:tetratricopeptide (TPR) repeat protein
MNRFFRSLVISILALWKGLSQKEIGSRTGMPGKKVSRQLARKDLDDVVFHRLLAGVEAKPAEVAIVNGCLESLRGLEENGDLTPGERETVEFGLLEATRLLRPAFTESVRRSRQAPPADRYPEPGEVEPARWHAARLWEALEPLPEDHRLAVVKASRAYQTWALVERVCEESTVQASRDLESAASLARLAHEIAERVEGAPGWCLRVRGLASLHGANVLRVAGELDASDTTFEQAKRRWHEGSDPDRILDPGRPYDLEASLRRDQRRFEEALALLDQARDVGGRSPARYLINKGFTLEVMGEYERAVRVLQEAEPLVEQQGDPRQRYMWRFNLAVNEVHLGRLREASELLRQVQESVVERGDRTELVRVTWLEGRIAAGLGQTGEAFRLLGRARQAFAEKKMEYDVALCLLEEAALLLDEGRTGEVKTLAQELARVFQSKRVHREALAALRLFQDAAERQEATAGLARRVLGYLFRARYDQGLRFES